MTQPTSLHNGFAASIPQTTQDVQRALRDGLLSLDANVLLNFYRFSPKARDALVEVMQAAGDRVWVSHQAAREFWRNRCRAIDDRNEASKQLQAALDKNERAGLSAVDIWGKQTAAPEEIRQAVRSTLSEGYERARETFEAEVQGAGAVAYDPDKDSVLEVLKNLLSAHVGPPLDEQEHADAVAEGARRAQNGIPPGFRDAEKEASGGRDGASGDYLVWLQSVTESCRRGLPLVIVTGDEKDDWWWKHKSAFMGPRSELVEEFAQLSNERLYMLRPVQLIEHADALNVSVPQDAAADVERASSDERKPRWTGEAVAALLQGLEQEGWEQAKVIRFAATQGGTIDREQIYAIAGYGEDRQLRGFTRPAARITRRLQDEGVLLEGVEAILVPIYDNEGIAVQFEIPLDVVEILSADADDS